MPGLTIKIEGDVGDFTKKLDEATKATTGFSVPAIAGFAGVAGVAVVAAGKIAEFTQAAAEDRTEQEKLETVYKNTGAAVGDYVGAIDTAIKAGQDKAFSDSEVRAGLQPLITATSDAQEANKLLATAMDVARFSGVDLETASNAVAKAAAGQDTQLRKLIPGLEKGATATDTIANAQKIAAGSADDYANSSEGMGKKSSDAFNEITETIGSAFLPILDELLPAILPIIEVIGELAQLLVLILKPAIHVIVEVLKILLSGITEVIGWIKQLIDWVNRVIDALGRIKVPDIKLPSLPFGLGVPTAELATVSQFGASQFNSVPSGGSANFIFNISGDPATIERTVISALRSYSRRNGVPIAGVTG
jgi:hypothetical protein